MLRPHAQPIPAGLCDAMAQRNLSAREKPRHPVRNVRASLEPGAAVTVDGRTGPNPAAILLIAALDLAPEERARFHVRPSVGRGTTPASSATGAGTSP